jgi:hypothetical protein
MLRVLCKALVLLQETKASEAWLEDQIPEVLRDVYGRLKARAVAADEAMVALTAMDSPVAPALAQVLVSDCCRMHG